MSRRHLDAEPGARETWAADAGPPRVQASRRHLEPEIAVRTSQRVLRERK